MGLGCEEGGEGREEAAGRLVTQLMVDDHHRYSSQASSPPSPASFLHHFWRGSDLQSVCMCV